MGPGACVLGLVAAGCGPARCGLAACGLRLGAWGVPCRPAACGASSVLGGGEAWWQGPARAGGRQARRVAMAGLSGGSGPAGRRLGANGRGDLRRGQAGRTGGPHGSRHVDRAFFGPGGRRVSGQKAGRSGDGIRCRPACGGCGRACALPGYMELAAHPSGIAHATAECNGDAKGSGE